MKKLAFALLGAWYSLQSLALPLPVPGLTDLLSFDGLPIHFSDEYDFEGIVALSNCSGSLVRFENSSDVDAAMVLTNGHCLEGGFIQPGQFVLDKKSNRIFTLLDKGAKAAGRVSAKTILYGTMTKTDMALYQLEKSFSQILNEFNVKPLTLASEYAEVETGIEILSGYWKRGYACEHNGVVHKLNESNWTWEDSIRYSQPGCETIPGTSGSPIIARGSKTVVGVNNTGNEDGEECTMNNPCEVDAEGKTTFKKGLSYGQQIAWVYDCMGPDHKFDLNLPSCKLPK